MGRGVIERGGPTLFYFVDSRWGRMGMNLLFSRLIKKLGEFFKLFKTTKLKKIVIHIQTQIYKTNDKKLEIFVKLSKCEN
jgi:hypothetical protein